MTSNSKIDGGPETVRQHLLEQLRRHAAEHGVTHSEIAASAGMHRSNVARIMAGRYSPTLDNFLRIAAALKLHIQISE